MTTVEGAPAGPTRTRGPRLAALVNITDPLVRVDRPGRSYTVTPTVYLV